MTELTNNPINNDSTKIIPERIKIKLFSVFTKWLAA